MLDVRCLFAASLLLAAGGLSLLAGETTAVRDVVYSQADEQPLLADVYMPAGEGPYPGVLCVHGGAWLMGNKSHMGWVGKQMAQRGFTAVSINYRLAPQHKFPAQLEDCQNAVRWMRTNAAKYHIDSTKIAGYGYSAGGQLVALLGTLDPAMASGAASTSVGPSTRLQAVVAGGAPCDFRMFPPEEKALAYWLGGTRRQQPELYDLASPCKFVSADDPPMMFFHGEKDTLVDKLLPTAMSAQLKHVGVASEMLLLPEQGHVLTMFDTKALDAGIRFLERHLKSRGQEAGPGGQAR